MPTYEYICTECQTKFEVFATVNEKEKGIKPECPNCHSKKTVQVFGNILVMGGGSKNGGFVSGCGPSSGPGCCG